jgi:NADH dehydrogenase [ubiquinone] 1 alpha subcomplex assembly factor 1
MKYLLLSSTLFIGCNEETEQVDEQVNESEMFTMRIDFGENSESDWFVMNDDVMGGVSIGDTYYTDTTMVFEGEVSTENNGGFVSFRSPTGDYDLSQYTQMEISYKSEGHNFTMIIADELMWYLPEFRLEVIPTSTDWTTSTTSLYDFKQFAMTDFGEAETGVEMSPEFLSDVIRLELRNSDFASGEFRLEIDYIEFQGYIEE